MNSVIEQNFRCYLNLKSSDWHNFLFKAKFSYSNSIQESIKYTLFYANYGYNPRYSLEIPSCTDIPQLDKFNKDLSLFFKTLNKIIKQAWKKQEEFTKICHIEAPSFKQGDKVWFNSLLIIHNKNKKFKPRKQGSYKIIKKTSSVSYMLFLPKKIIIYPIIHASELEPFYENHFGK